ncbi:MAG: hypothetical protein NVSMB13_09530 [Mycobacteriales bacterium]
MTTTARRTSAAPAPAAVSSSASPTKASSSATPTKTPSAAVESATPEATPSDEPFPTPVEAAETATTASADLPSLAPIAAGERSSGLQSQRVMLIGIAPVSLIAVVSLGGLTVARGRR